MNNSLYLLLKIMITLIMIYEKRTEETLLFVPSISKPNCFIEDFYVDNIILLKYKIFTNSRQNLKEVLSCNTSKSP